MDLILAYHGIDGQVEERYRWVEYRDKTFDLTKLRVSPNLFEKQLSYLKSHDYQTVSLDDLLECQRKGLRLPQKSFALTFDDGFKDFLTLAYPALKRCSYTATIFLITNKINESYQNKQFLSWDEIYTLRKEGFSFGAHTCSHPLLTSLSLEEARYEIEESKRIIEEKLNSPVRFFSYPYGQFNLEIQNLVRKANFTGAVVTPHGPGIENGPFSLKRVGINSMNPMWVFRLKVKGAFAWMRDNRILWPMVNKIKGKTG
jgi:peptidoglycan/xylan/chitin deacetylase (PgdA/CDA1 family)